MTLRWMYDASEPPPEPPRWHVAAGYIGGDTPHVWSKAEWDAQLAPFRLPIFTASNRQDTVEAAGADAWVIWAAAHTLGIPSGATICVDTETTIYSTYLKALDFFTSPWPLMNYGSLSFVTRNPMPSGGRWAADWTDDIEAGVDLVGESGIRAVQWASSAMLGKPWDASVIEDSVPLWRNA